MKDIKEIKELFAGVALLAKAVKAVAKDGKVDFSDMTVVMELINNSKMLVEAVKDVKAIPEELKDLSKEELIELISIVYGAIEVVEKQ